MNKNPPNPVEPYRPQYHFTPEAEWLNDPNGLVYYEGEYHLFFQHNPFEPVWGRMHWGHAVSRDLVHWKRLPIALAPDELGYVFSGSAVLDRNDTSGFFEGGPGLVAIYTSAREKKEESFLQRQCVAYSSNRGRSWKKFDGNPVLENPGLLNFRDPKVFRHEPTEKWVMVVTSQSGVRFYGSPDLKDWTLLSEFGEGFGSHSGVWECPNLFPLPGEGGERKWVLAAGDVHGGPAEGSRLQYFVGDFDGIEFTPCSSPEENTWADYGQDFYAAQTWNNLPGSRQVWIGWLSNLNYQEEIPTTGWRGSMSVPRELGLERDQEGYRLVQQPVEELGNLRGESRSWKGLRLSGKSSFNPELTGKSLEVALEADPGTSEEFGLKLRKSGDQETIVGYQSRTNKLFVDRSGSGKIDFSESYPGRHEAPLEPEGDEIRLRIFLDSSSVEVFGNGGKRVISDLIFPDADGKEVKLFAEGGEIRISNLEIYRLNSIWS